MRQALLGSLGLLGVSPCTDHTIVRGTIDHHTPCKHNTTLSNPRREKQNKQKIDPAKQKKQETIWSLGPFWSVPPLPPPVSWHPSMSQ